MPAIFDRMQAADEDRATAVVNSFGQILAAFKKAAANEARALGAAEQACLSFDRVSLEKFTCQGSNFYYPLG